MKKLFLCSMQVYIGHSSPTHRHCERRAPFLGSKAKRGNPAIKVFAERHDVILNLFQDLVLFRSRNKFGMTVSRWRDLFNWVAAPGFASKRKHAARNDGTFGGNAPPKLAHCIFLCLGLLAFILPTPALGTKKDITGQIKPSSSLEEVSLLTDDNTPNNLEAANKKISKSANRFFWGVMTCLCASVASFSGLFTYWVINAHNQPLPQSGCENICWYLREFPGLPQGGYFYTGPSGEWLFVNCTTQDSTTLSSTAASELSTTITNLTAVYPGQVEFLGTHDGYAVCTHPGIANNETIISDVMPELVDMPTKGASQ